MRGIYFRKYFMLHARALRRNISLYLTSRLVIPIRSSFAVSRRMYVHSNMRRNEMYVTLRTRAHTDIQGEREREII